MHHKPSPLGFDLSCRLCCRLYFGDLFYMNVLVEIAESISIKFHPTSPSLVQPHQSWRAYQKLCFSMLVVSAR